MTVYRKADIDSSLKYLKFSFSSNNSPECIMTLRSAGGMGFNTDKDNIERKTILNNLGIEKYYKLHQIHSRNVFNAEELENSSITDGDGLFTFRKEDVLSVTVADCMPVFFSSRSSGAFGVLHSGWKGTGISLEALKKIKKYTSADDFEFILGPSIGPCCYEVDENRAEIFKKMYGSSSVVIGENDSDHRDVYKKRYYLDLRKANAVLLESNGIKNITVIENCTCCSENFYSFRGDGAEQYRLMLALIGYFR